MGEGLNAAYDKEMVKRLDELGSLPADEKKRIFDYMDLIIRDYKTKKIITNKKTPDLTACRFDIFQHLSFLFYCLSFFIPV